MQKTTDVYIKKVKNQLNLLIPTSKNANISLISYTNLLIPISKNANVPLIFYTNLLIPSPPKTLYQNKWPVWAIFHQSSTETSKDEKHERSKRIKPLVGSTRLVYFLFLT